MGARVIGLELEDTRTVAVAVDDAGKVLARAQANADGDLGAAAAKALAQVRSANPAAPRSVLGVAAVNPESAAVAPVIAQLAIEFGSPAVRGGAVLSGTAAAAAEAWVGAARGLKDVVFFGVGEHTTGGVVRDGVAIMGARGRAGLVAWLALNPVEREDYRKTGCLEAEVAAAGIVRRIIWRIKAGDRSRVQDIVKEDFSAITADHVLTAARGGDGVSISVVRDTAKYLGMAAANLVAISDPEILVLGGIMASAADLLLEPIRTEIARRLPKPMLDALRIETALLGDDAAAIGAARIVTAAIR
ncbi:MAG TPA: ROK family protein [Vicinamibacterales bacterium]|nr:ROK family protein [Vicinamibacterales bacterium]